MSDLMHTILETNKAIAGIIRECINRCPQPTLHPIAVVYTYIGDVFIHHWSLFLKNTIENNKD